MLLNVVHFISRQFNGFSSILQLNAFFSIIKVTPMVNTYHSIADFHLYNSVASFISFWSFNQELLLVPNKAHSPMSVFSSLSNKGRCFWELFRNIGGRSLMCMSCLNFWPMYFYNKIKTFINTNSKIRTAIYSKYM